MVRRLRLKPIHARRACSRLHSRLVLHAPAAALRPALRLHSRPPPLRFTCLAGALPRPAMSRLGSLPHPASLSCPMPRLGAPSLAVVCLATPCRGLPCLAVPWALPCLPCTDARLAVSCRALARLLAWHRHASSQSPHVVLVCALPRRAFMLCRALPKCGLLTPRSRLVSPDPASSASPFLASPTRHLPRAGSLAVTRLDSQSNHMTACILVCSRCAPAGSATSRSPSQSSSYPRAARRLKQVSAARHTRPTYVPSFPRRACSRSM